MTLTKQLEVVDVLKDAQDLIGRPDGWARGTAVQRRYPYGGGTHYAFCATAAVDVALGFRSRSGELAYPSGERRQELREQAVKALVECIPQARLESLSRGDQNKRTLVERFNDSSEKDEVLAMFQCAVDQAAKHRKPVTGWKRWTAWRW